MPYAKSAWVASQLVLLQCFIVIIWAQAASVAQIAVVDTSTVSVQLSSPGVSQFLFEWSPNEGTQVASDPTGASFTLLNLTAGRMYNYTVLDASLNISTVLDTGTFYPNPEPVSRLRVSMDLSPTTSLRAAWNRPLLGDVQEYHVTLTPVTPGLSWIGVIASESAALVILSSDQKTVGVRDAMPGTTYSVTAYAVSNGQRSAPSVMEHVTYPAAPTLNPVLVGSTSLGISWAAGQGGVTIYSLSIHRDGVSDPLTLPVRASVTEMQYTNAVPGSFYTVELIAFFSGFASGKDSKNVTTLPSTPEQITYSQNSTSISLSWQPGPGLYDQFDLRLTDHSQSHISVLNSSHVYHDLTPGLIYTVTLRSQSGPKQSLPATVVVTLDPVSPEGLSVDSKTEGTAQLIWDAADAREQRFEAAIQAIESNLTFEAVNVTGNTVTFVGLLPGHTYVSTVRGLSQDGTRYSTPGATLTFTARPLIPTSLTQDNVTTSSVSLSWSPPIDGLLDSFSLDLIDNRTSLPVYAAAVIPYNDSILRYTYVAQGLLPGSTLNAVVSSVSNGVPSRDDTQFFAHTVPLSPSNLTVDYIGTESVELSWMYPSANESLFDRASVKTYSLTPSGKQPLARAYVMSPNSLHEVRGLYPGSSYEFHVSLVSGAMVSEPAIVTVTTRLGAVPGIGVDVNTTAIVVVWSPPADTMFSYYELILHTVPPVTLNISKDTPFLLHVFGSLTPGQTYEVSLQTVSPTDRGNITTRSVTTKPESVRDVSVVPTGANEVEISFSATGGSIQDSFEVTLVRDDFNKILRTVPYVSGQSAYTLREPDLLSGHAYNVTISAKSMDRSSRQVRQTFTAAPDSPVNLQAQASETSSGSVHVTWENPPGIQYDTVELVYQGSRDHTPATPEPPLPGLMGTATVAGKTGLFPGETYTLSVRFVSNGVAGPPSIANFTIPPSAPEMMPGFPQFTSTSITLSWNLSPTLSVAEQWLVAFKAKEELEYPPEQSIVLLKEQTTYTLRGLDAGRFYDFKVYAVSGGGDFVPSTHALSGRENTIPLCDFIIREERPLTTNNTVALSFTENTSPYFDSYKFCLGSVECPGARALVDKSQWVPGKVITFRDLPEAGNAYHVYRLVTSGNKLAPCKGQSDSYIYTRPNPVTRVTPVPTGQSVQLLIRRPPGHVTQYQIDCAGPNCSPKTVQPAVGELHTGVTFGDLQGSQSYQFTVTVVSGAVTGYEKRSDPFSVVVATMIGRPSPVRNVSVMQNPHAPYQVLIRWLAPEKRNGPLRMFRIRYRRVSAREPYRHILVPAGKLDLYATQLGSVYQPLVPGDFYEFRVSVNTSAGFSLETVTNLALATVAPPLLVPVNETAPLVGAPEEHSVQIQLKNVFSDLYGPVDGYSVIVVELARDVSLDHIKTYKEIFNTTSPWPPYYAFYNCDIFSNPSNCLPSSNTQSPGAPGLPPRNRVGKRSAGETLKVKRAAFTNGQPGSVTVTLGSDTMEDCIRTNKRHCNGPLKPNTEYYFVLRAHNGAGATYTDTKASPTARTRPLAAPPGGVAGSGVQGGDMGLAIALPLALLLVSSLILAAVLFVRKRRSPKPTTTPSPAYHATGGLDLSLHAPKASDRVHVKDFREYVRRMAADSDFGFSESYEELKPVGRDQPVSHSELPVNRAKNRFTNILPYDNTRVKLLSEDDDEGSDYVNANFMPGFSSKREFIVTQGPLPSTTDDFWRMMWEQNVKAIVMLTKCVEKGREKCFHYWPHDNDLLLYGDIQCQVKRVTTSELWVITEIQLNKGEATRTVKHFHYIAWPDFGVPTNTEAIIRFVRLVRSEMTANPGGPLLTHCSAGVGRSGTYIVLDRMLQHIVDHDYIDIFGTIYEMRKHRMYMVQTEQQYIFLHKALLSELENLQIIGQDNKGFDDDFC